MDPEALILDFGGQYAHLICRRCRELGVYSELVHHGISARELGSRSPKALIFSGSPASVYRSPFPDIDREILDLGIPILGICYGAQLLAVKLGGKVIPGGREFGRALLKILQPDPIFEGIPPEFQVWMSHSDSISEIDAQILARTQDLPIAAFRSGNLYGICFHPEVEHTQHGSRILENFLYKVAGCRGGYSPEFLVDQVVNQIRDRFPQGNAICAVSGGVDSTTAALIAKRAFGDRLHCVFVDHGLFRKSEPERVLDALKRLGFKNLIFVDGSKRFLEKLKGVRDPEQKRKIIGEEFARIFEEIAARIGDVRYLVQGTIYPDRVESAAAGIGTERIKTHHNVAGIPAEFKLQLIEPLRDLYKDEVRKLAKSLGVPREILESHPFPGPGLAARIIGEVTPEKLRICREASDILEQELRASGIYQDLWQAFAIVGDDKATGVMGDKRELGYMVTLRMVKSKDAMTADFAKIPYQILERISNRIVNEVEGVTWVNYAITSKPPATIEPQ